MLKVKKSLYLLNNFMNFNEVFRDSKLDQSYKSQKNYD